MTHDLLGLFDRFKPKFVKQYADLNTVILNALKNYRHEVLQGQFPGEDYRFTMKDGEWNKLQ